MAGAGSHSLSRLSKCPQDVTAVEGEIEDIITCDLASEETLSMGHNPDSMQDNLTRRGCGYQK